jgi:hypothetical protein
VPLLTVALADTDTEMFALMLAIASTCEPTHASPAALTLEKVAPVCATMSPIGFESCVVA